MCNCMAHFHRGSTSVSKLRSLGLPPPLHIEIPSSDCARAPGHHAIHMLPSRFALRRLTTVNRRPCPDAEIALQLPTPRAARMSAAAGFRFSAQGPARSCRAPCVDDRTSHASRAEAVLMNRRLASHAVVDRHARGACVRRIDATSHLRTGRQPAARYRARTRPGHAVRRCTCHPASRRAAGDSVIAIATIARASSPAPHAAPPDRRRPFVPP